MVNEMCTCSSGLNTSQEIIAWVMVACILVVFSTLFVLVVKILK